MKINKKSVGPALALCALLGAGVWSTAFSQAPAIQRTIIQRADVSVPNREAIVAKVEVAPGILAGRHTHPGDEISYVLEGEGELLVEGQPPRPIKTGDAFVIPAGIKHDVKVGPNAPLKLIGVYVVEKGQPLATPAP